VVPGYPNGIMPTNFSQTLTNDEINSLVAYLLSRK
jgi:hypothetical protein